MGGRCREGKKYPLPISGSLTGVLQIRLTEIKGEKQSDVY